MTLEKEQQKLLLQKNKMIEFTRKWNTIAGPCSAESLDQVLTSARRIKAAGGDILRAGLWKPRTSPDAWQGPGDEGVEWMVEAKKQTGIAISTEVKSTATIEKTLLAGFDLLWIGSRNGQNYDLLDEIGRTTSDSKLPVLLKRSMSASLEEWVGAAGYIARYNPNVILCERGVRGYSPDTRNILDLQTAYLAKQQSGLPVVIDVSHAAGRRDLITPMAVAAKAVGFDGLMVEVHPTPSTAKTDSKQQISLDDFDRLMETLNRVPDSQTIYGSK